MFITRIKFLIISILINFICIKNNPAIAEIDKFNIDNRNYDTLLGECLIKLTNNEAVLLYSYKNPIKISKNPYQNIKKIILGNQNSGKRAIKTYNPTSAAGSSSDPIPELQFHHVIFKDMRETLPGIPYVCFQTPRGHHNAYHRDLKRLNIKFNDFTTINSYLSQLEQHTIQASEKEKDEYSRICGIAAKLGMDIQKLYINQKYEWLNLASGSKYLMMANRILAANTFPNIIIINKDLCMKYHTLLEKERNLYSYINYRIENDEELNNHARHIRKILETRIKALDIYTREDRRVTLSRDQAIHVADKNHGKCGRLYKVKLRIENEYDSDSESIASSLEG